jgi:hypothetical protein
MGEFCVILKLIIRPFTFKVSYEDNGFINLIPEILRYAPQGPRNSAVKLIKN